ncbi:FAD-dependent oxidoreductase [Streptomyces flaveolus]|uniref:FAD-dependent oxidoreductase n=1 Tax=Streptomyces flaveolus TaxID=67297 RepID=UPI00380984CF
MSADVIVSGAGPVGLLTAALLDSAGVKGGGPRAAHRARRELPCRRPAPPHAGGPHHRACRGRPHAHRHPAVARPHGAPDALRHAPATAGLHRAGHPHPYILQITQATTERVLASLVEARGIPVHYGQQVTGFEQDDTVARVRSGDTGPSAAGPDSHPKLHATPTTSRPPDR